MLNYISSRQLRVLAKFTFPIIQFSLVEIGLLFILQNVGVGYTQITKKKKIVGHHTRFQLKEETIHLSCKQSCTENN